MRTLCFVTRNANKLKEIQHILGDGIRLVTLADIGCIDPIPEPFETIHENSKAKALYVWEHYDVDCFADDSGLVIPALNGEPGVHSAHYAGPQRDDKANIRLVWEKLKNKANREAYFLTVITLVLDGEIHVFEGKAEGEIRMEEKGQNGFGYDPIFQPQGYEVTFAEMSLDEKSKISHRSKAFQKLKAFLQTVSPDSTL